MQGRGQGPILARVAALVALNLLLAGYADIGLEAKLAWEAHLGGFIAGWVLGYWIAPGQSAAPRECLSPELTRQDVDPETALDRRLAPQIVERAHVDRVEELVLDLVEARRHRGDAHVEAGPLRLRPTGR